MEPATDTHEEKTKKAAAFLDRDIPAVEERRRNKLLWICLWQKKIKNK